MHYRSSASNSRIGNCSYNALMISRVTRAQSFSMETNHGLSSMIMKITSLSFTVQC